MPEQEIREIEITSLHLWTENPRDPIDKEMSDYDVIKRAIDEKPEIWDLGKLIKEMGSHYDFSEIPTVVYEDNIPIVFDGNRRIAIIKYFQNKELYSSLTGKLYFGDGPQKLVKLEKVPCNVCNMNIALDNIERKHVQSGSWGALEREYFLSRHRGQKKSTFLIIDESTNMITSNPSLNKRFVKEEILTEKNLNEIGFGFQNDKFVSVYDNDKQPSEILEQIIPLIENKEITTRANRGELKKVLIDNCPGLKKTIEPFHSSNNNKIVNPVFPVTTQIIKRTPITKDLDIMFGKTLVLKEGKVNDLYRAICLIHEKFKKEKSILPILAMSLRLILDVAGRCYFIDQNDLSNAERDNTYKEFIKKAKKHLSQEQKNTLLLNGDWLSSERNIEAVFAKYAHGHIVCKYGDILKDSIIVGDIINFYFGKHT